MDDMSQIGKLFVWTFLMIPGYICYSMGSGVVTQQGIQMTPIGQF